ncbi:proteasome regulatory subunit Rpn7/26S proteasome subunit 6 [Cryptosporidium ryanae]|uniref:proteasome regulatory subunit Rpn7/26S proteasome subunit 6 n=1 Tax=Cryptosporidium ryanae TaxID=515981 RepID=UPI00351AACE1|nr:proteasome regulatory subunit Rpn7/26S proteasome subunit 6 [Cryptosporidium ryanae]
MSELKQIMDHVSNPEELLQIVPDLELTELIHISGSIYSSEEEKSDSRRKIIEKIKLNCMVPLYESLVKNTTVFKLDEKTISDLSKENDKELKIIDEKIKDAIENYGDLEVRNCQYEKLVYLTRIGDKQGCLKELEVALERTVGGLKIELLFLGVRIGLFWNDSELVKSFLLKSQDQLNTTSDWERRNRFKVYDAVHKLSTRKFFFASELLLDSLTTFTAVELMSFDRLIFYTILTSILSLDRMTLKNKLLTCPDILKIALQPDRKYLLGYIENFYNGKYLEFSRILLDIIFMIRKDIYLYPHYKFYLRSIRLRAYKQYLEPFESVSILRMADSFGVSPQFLEKDIVTFISSSKLPCTIDKVKQTIICNYVDRKINNYNEIIEKGDALLNRLQKLSRIIQI